MAARLSPEERLRRHKLRVKKSFSSAAYQHYDPIVEGYGSPEQWAATVEALFADTLRYSGGDRLRTGPKPNSNLVILGLTELPESMIDLKKAYRAALHLSHPDHGGTNDAVRAVITAFGELGKLYS